MAIDGSFSFESAVERFLDRCPKLGSVPQFESMAKRGGMVTDEVMDVVAELFIHPKYTIPLIGCFCPVAQKIVDRSVALLSCVTSLGFNSDETTKNFDDAEIVNFITFYDQNRRGLDLHELACLALCRALDLAPFLLGSTIAYFKFAPPPFQSLLIRVTASELSTEVTQFLQAARISYRFLILEPDVFSKLWDWSSFLDLVKKASNLKMGDIAPKIEEGIADLRWCGIQILSVILKMSDKTIANFGVEAEEALSCFLRWEEFCMDVSLEKAGLYIGSSKNTKLSTATDNIGFNQENFLQSFGRNSVVPSLFYEIKPSSRRQRIETRDDSSASIPFVLTSSVKKSFEMVQLAVSQKWPVLLYGPPGIGKSALINKLAHDTGNQVLSIHMDGQIDGKTLVGSYVCTEQPGEFKWQPGSLTQAVLNGIWVVFEDIEKAPSDVQSILLPLLEGVRTFVTGHGEEIRVAESFRLFSTISTFKLDTSCGAEGGNLLGFLWRRVMIQPASNEDLQNIVKAWYPSLEPLAGKFIETFERVNTGPHQLVAFQSGNSASFSSLSRFSLRDLLKWCKRVVGLGFNSIGDGLSAYECQCIYQEAVDIFASFSTSAENRLTMMKEIAKLWAVNCSLLQSLYPSNKPVIQDLLSELRFGRVSLNRAQTLRLHDPKRPFVEIRSSLTVLEKIACSVKYNEPVLLVGETGTGKTTLVQHLATRLGQRLTVLNLSQQSDVADLLGGFKPMDAQFICIPLYKEFENLFAKTFSVKVNNDFLVHLQRHLNSKNWTLLLSGLQKGLDFFRKSVDMGRSGSGKKRKKPLDEEQLKAWEDLAGKLESARGQIGGSSGMLFSFVEGAFVTALRNGEWILLDEVNLAPPETMQRVIGVLEGENGSICLAERGDANYIHRHPNFRIFACMNPATDAGKRDLPYSLRSRFTEYFVDDVLDDEDLMLFINQFTDDIRSSIDIVKIVRFYKVAKKESEERLQDGANQKPQYSLRSLYRALEYTRKAFRKFGFQRAIYDGFCMFFLTLLDETSAKVMNQMILSYILGGNLPPHVAFDRYLEVRGNSLSDDLIENYVLTKSVKEHLRNLARAIFIKRYPVLLQGPTSSGKTSMVQYLAAVTGHEFVRINNHEHTDLQEYLGSYITDACGKLVFHEGVLVKAVRNGHWIVLDELNLAPSDVLEAMNRLLDDNREIFVPELRETVRAHPNFMLFATQNPPTFYGGRKMLSRAFRNRFVEIHVDEIPEDELSTILERRCKIPESYAKKMVKVMEDLQLHRQSSKVFAGKHGFITPRDLFRWAGRFRDFGKSYEDLARDGYYLLAERLRDEGEKSVVQEVLEKQLRVRVVQNDLYNQEPVAGDVGVSESLGSVVWTKSMLRLYFLVERCYKLREPVLLVGETGGGKTTVCQLLSMVMGAKLHILNCHQYTETSDFLGGFFPIRDRSMLMSEFKDLIEQLVLSKAFIHFPTDLTISSDIGQASATLDKLAVILNSYRQGLVSHPEVTIHDLDTFEKRHFDLAQLHQRWQMIFMWQDGPLLQAMKSGDLFLVDEISLADDSVLERLNSVLEPERKLSLAEKGGPVLEKITAHPNFFLLATMNPGGDYGKKELSPALRNRFTELWVPSVGGPEELRSIAIQRISRPELLQIVDPMLNFWEWFNQLQTGRMLTVRDLLAWVAFVNVSEGSLGPDYAFLHGVFLVLLDGLSLGTDISRKDAGELRERCLSFLLEQLKVGSTSLAYSSLSNMGNYGWGNLEKAAGIACGDNMQCDNIFGIDPLYIEKGSEDCEVGGFEFMAPTTCRNSLRVLRAMQLPKPVLLEGSPGVGKTSLVVALGKFSGHKVVRINLSEQTDIMDLLGSDLPVESDDGMKFAWSDGILLQAIKEGCWVLLDELNLAPQSVLEGLNAILDHRAEVFIPELGRTFRCPSSFRVFACQNPSYQGGGRKSLPKSFLNRFTKVYVDELAEDDYLFICSSLYPSLPRPLLSKLILFNKLLHEDTMLHHKFAQDGSPWEFNLRDVIRSCQIMQDAPENSKFDCFLNVVYVQRMRTAADRREVLRLYERVFGSKPSVNPFPRVQLNSQYLIVGNTAIKRNYFAPSHNFSDQLKILPAFRHSLEAAAHCVKHQWLCILIGPSSSGKTSLIRLLAQLTSNILNELNLSSVTDISELLGCFEQYNAFRNFRCVVAQVECYINEYFRLQLEASTKTFISERKDLVIKWLTFVSNMDSGSMSLYMKDWKKLASSLSLLVEIIEELKSDLERDDLPLSWSCKELNKTKRTISKLQVDQQKRVFSAKFEWVMGLLIKAIENGEWIVLENANSCNPTVLDRINSLVEQCGSITVNECGIVDGKPVVLHPHPNFRMFLTVNPRFGEVSRAMRNRGIEIFMMQPYWLLNKGSDDNYEEIGLKDVQRFIVLSGIPVGKLVAAMAKAHVYVRDEGIHLNVHITYLELARWVQLFQQLLVNGNQPLWSLQISFEHIYISSVGEAAGNHIIRHAKISYLTRMEFSELDSSMERSLCLPGGWPMPLKLRDFIRYSQEACVKQNCMYLEFLGASCASYEFRISWNRCLVDQDLVVSGFAKPYLMDANFLHSVMFPKGSSGLRSISSWKTKFNLELANKMLLFSSNWIIEQATESDLSLYLLWFSWFSSQLEPFCQFFKTFLNSLKQELEHPIWKCVKRCRHELKLIHEIDLKMHPIPMLSLEIVDFVASNDSSKLYCRLLCNAIKCIGLLRLTYQQWNAESVHDYNDEARGFIPMLKALRVLEEEILNVLVESPSFDLLAQLYTDLLENHMLFWNGVTSSQVERSLISWRSLTKDATKFQDFCPRAVEILLMEIRNLNNVSSWRLHSEKSLLWVYGGHPCLPSSPNLYDKQQQLLKLCESVWPTNKKSCDLDNVSLVDIIASTNPELRTLALQGICMSSHITGICEDEVRVIHQLEEMYQILMGRFDFEKSKLEAHFRSNDDAFLEENAPCCVINPEMLCRKSVFENWQDTLPTADVTSFFLDVKLLQELSSIILVDSNALELALGCLSNILESALKYSLTFSSRPPLMFLPHQKILWTLDAWTSVDAVDAKIATFILEMWFRWHQSLWTYCPAFVKNFFKVDGHDIPEPDMLVQPVRTASVMQIMHNKLSIKDYWVHRLKLKVASSNLWRSSQLGTELPKFLLSAARSLFQQIIYAHKKSFDADKFAAIKSIFCSWEKNTIMQDDIQIMHSLIASSSHQKLKSLLDSFIEPLLRQLFVECSSTDTFYSLGCAWLHVGGLRFHLLLSSDDLDPAVKYSCKFEQLSEKISLLELETEVRKECDYLSGRCFANVADGKRALLINLEHERKRMQRKVIFRSDPNKFKKLKYEASHECARLLESAMVLAKNIDGMNSQMIDEEVHNWQETATCFIGRLSDEYTAYVDIVQPVLVAVYEMKLGLSMVLSDALKKRFLLRVKVDNMDRVLDTIRSFMRFPRVYGSEFNFVDLNRGVAELSSCNVDLPTNFCTMDINFLEKLVTVSTDANADAMASVLQRKAAVYENILVRVSHFVANSQLMDKSSFMLLDKIFNKFVSSWIEMKVHAKTKEEYDAQQYKFRPRAFKIESILDVDISTLGKVISNDSFSEWQELLTEEDSTNMGTIENPESLEEEWSLVQENFLNNMVHIHNQLFGSINLFLPPGLVQISDSDRLVSFIESYTLGVGMIKGFRGLYSSRLDAELVPEHLLRLCLEHKQKFVSSYQSVTKYNFYKDSNAPMMDKMVKLLTSLQQRVLLLLSEREDDHGLQKILDVIEMLLAIPLSTPLAKALSGLQFLLNRVRVLQENGSKFSLTGQLEPIISLVSSWQKMEFESWPALLDEVQLQYEINAGKLWFPLYSVLQHRQSADIAGYNQSTIQSLEEFVQTSSIGEFRRRLQLLLAFHGQISTGKCLETYSSPCQIENLKILYNVFGFYVQFLPTVMEHIEAKRRSIEMELKDLLKLCHWERFDSYSAIESSKKTRQKLRKLIQKYSDLLQQPVMLIFNQESAQKGMKVQSQQGLKLHNVFSDKNAGKLTAALDLAQFDYEERLMWCAGWREKVAHSLHNLHLGRMPAFLEIEDIASTKTQYFASQSADIVYHEEMKDMWCTLGTICTTTRDCANLWVDTNKSIGKRRALTHLLKQLEDCGLSRHKSATIEDKLNSNQSTMWFLQPSYDIQHLLLTQCRLSCGTADVTDPSNFQSSPRGSSSNDWKTANEYYFKSMVSVLLLRQISLKFHKDFNIEQVNKSGSFLDHLIAIEQKQRVAAYRFFENVKSLRECTSALESFYRGSPDSDIGSGSGCSVTRKQGVTFKCMWQQKLLFDSLCVMLNEEILLLRTVESTHLNTCPRVKAEANELLSIFERFILVFKKSKETLDKYLLGSNEATIMVAGSFRPYFISKQMEQFVLQNFQALEEFEGQLLTFQEQDPNRSSVKETLLNHFSTTFKKGKLMAEQFSSVVEEKKLSTNPCEATNCGSETCSDLEAEFGGALRQTYEHIIVSLRKLGSMSNGHASSDESLGKITSWESLFESYLSNLSLDLLFDKLLKTIHCAEKLLSYSGLEVPNLSCQIGENFKHVHMFLDLILNFADCLLQDVLAMHKTVTIMTHVLANVFASLYSNGFGISADDTADESSRDQDASGTGMGEGAGLNDVSDQITDEDQLLGASEKQGEEQDASNEQPSKNDKGIEMEQDFAADAYSVSEDSGEDEDKDSEDEQLESAMGETGADSEVVDEKMWNKDEDDKNPNDTNEKYESGPSVKDRDASSRELRAKEDGAATAEESGELADKPDDHDEIGSQDELGEPENMEDTNVDKEEAVSDPTGLKLDDENKNTEDDVEMDEKEGAVSLEGGPEEHDESAEDENHQEGETDMIDETMKEAETDQVGGSPEMNDPCQEGENPETNSMAPRKDAFEPGTSNLIGDQLPNAEPTTQLQGNSRASDSRNEAPEANWSSGSNINNDLTPMTLPSNSKSDTEIMLADSSSGGRFADDPRKTQLPQLESSSLRKSKPNPYRNVGDALEEWKERVKVSVDLQTEDTETQGEMEDDNANEYGYVSEFEKGTAQALGPATSEQVDKNVDGYKPPDGDSHPADGEDLAEMEIEKQNPEKHHVESSASLHRNQIKEQPQFDVENITKEGSPEEYSQDEGGDRSITDSLVSVKKSYMSGDIHQLSKLSISDNELAKAHDREDFSNDMKTNASAIWRKYELLTTRLSQELAEQLRLVMEPTLASKLQGDYKTGKRINMKKVIPYIASHYRKDKIWLRRTRPNKRDYQVVIAVDDSRSMSESFCGNVAIEALVTVCRAMSQLEMGNLAVASFGGNIKLLHDFDQPFTGEAGIKMISGLTFKQENTIADEPVVDLLKYLNTLLDAAVANARLPSGQNPLEQLVLIIGDGRFHEKASLKRCVRDALSKNRMVAFLLLDSPQESIVDLQEVLPFEGTDLKLTKYLDSFPFPYYIVLRNIEALPRTLADLLRQWFELTQNSQD